MHIIKQFITLDNNFSTELIIEQLIETVHIFICETQRATFFSISLGSPNSKRWYLQLGKKHFLAMRWAMQSCLLTNFFFGSFCRNEKFVFLKTLHRSWESLVTLQLPFDCWLVFWTIESEKQGTTTLWHTYQKGKMFQIWEGHVTWPKREKICLQRNVTWQWPKKSVFR